jgi:acetoin utilization protein AcuB
MDDSEWIVTREAASRLGVTPARVRQLVSEGKLTAQKLGGKYRGQWLVKSSDVMDRLNTKGESGTMKVKNRMTANPITASPKTSYNEALRLMERNNVQHLPIVEKSGKMVGIVTRSDMLQAEPSRVSSLSVYEIASLLEKVTMSQIMSSPVYAVEETCSISNAANFMLEKGIGCLPVVREGEVVGIITDTDIFKTFVEVTGGGEAGSRLEVKMPDQKGELARLTQALDKAGSYIVSLAIMYDASGDDWYADLKERGGDEDKIRQEIEKLGNAEIMEFRLSDDDKLLEYKN